jgi:hypothetical protein
MISSRFIVVILFLPVAAAVVAIVAVEDSAMVHHADGSGSTV